MLMIHTYLYFVYNYVGYIIEHLFVYSYLYFVYNYVRYYFIYFRSIILPEGYVHTYVVSRPVPKEMLDQNLATLKRKIYLAAAAVDRLCLDTPSEVNCKLRCNCTQNPLMQVLILQLRTVQVPILDQLCCSC
jgi:hypothetical protein